jgi:hypothetical protein
MTELTPPPNSSIGPVYGSSNALGPTFRLFTNNLWLITKLTVVIVAPLEILKVWSAPELEHDWQLQVGTFLLQWLSNVLIAPALIFALMNVIQTGVAPGVNECYRWGAGRLPKLIICAIMAGVLETLGTLLFIVPGVIIALQLSLVYPIAVLENSSPMNVLSDSKRLTKGHRMNILGAAIVILGSVAVMSAMIGALAGLAQGSFAFLILLVAAVIGDILSQASTVLFLVIYLGIRRTLEAGQAQ